MPGRTELMMVFHLHQPVGNFGDVFKRAHDLCYRPLLDAIAAHPEVRVSLHHSGPVLEWLLREEPAYLDELRQLVEREQVEVIGGGFYEPMLVMLSEEDARGQIEMLNGIVDRHLGVLPRGLWLAERVWDPDLPRVLARAGMQYTLLDDSHFHAAGLRPPAGCEMSGYHVTERAGHTLAVFPIARSLRYLIPYLEPGAALAQILSMGQSLRDQGRSTLLTYGDDAEKIGLWPGSQGLIESPGWLHRFFAMIEAEDDRLHTTTPSAVLARQRPQGTAYLPTAAYEEMDAWALPADSGRALHELRERAREAPVGSDLRRCLPYLRGGVWSGFFAKYPEANRMHKRMLQISRRLSEAFVAQRSDALYGEADDVADRLATAQRALYAGQCCCAYWHGWFGGITAPHLRHGVMRQLLAAEDLLDGLLLGDEPHVIAERLDLDGDFTDEALLSNRELVAAVVPERGGALLCLDDKRRKISALDVLARRPESYHADDEGGASDGPYDDQARLGFVDRFYAPDTSVTQVRDMQARELSGLSTARYRLVEVGCRDDIEDGGAEAVLRADCTLGRDDHAPRLRLAKRYLLARDAAVLQVLYSLTLEGDTPLRTLFAPELSLNLLATDDPQRQILCGDRPQAPLTCQSLDAAAGDETFALRDRHLGVELVIAAEGCARWWHYPVCTRSRGDQGVRGVFQGVGVHPCYELELRPGETLDLSIVVGVAAAAG